MKNQYIQLTPNLIVEQDDFENIINLQLTNDSEGELIINMPSGQVVVTENAEELYNFLQKKMGLEASTPLCG